MTDKPDDVRGGDDSLDASLAAGYELLRLLLPEGADADFAAIVAASGEVIMAFDTSIDSGEDPAFAANAFIVGISRLEEVHEDLAGLFVAARARVVTRLMSTGHVGHAAEVLASIPAGEEACAIMAGIQKATLLSGDIATAAELEARVMEIFDATAPEKSLAFLRETRRLIIESGPILGDFPLNSVSARLAERIGDGFDPIVDWAQTEADRYPEADILGIVALIRDDSLWAPDTPITTRMFLAHDAAASVSEITNAISSVPRPEAAALLKSFMKISNERLSGLPARSYLDGMVALAFYRRGMPDIARVIVRYIDNPGALGYVAESLLRLDSPNVAEAQKLALANPDRSITVGVLIEGLWPDRAIPDKILERITTIQTNRSGGGKGPIFSPYPVEMRIQCLQALADRSRSEGDVASAEDYLDRAVLLASQLERGIIKYKPSK